MTFLRPDLAPWALVVPVIVALWTIHRRCRGAFRRRLAIADRFAALSRRSTAARDLAVLAAGVVVAASLAAALLRPQLPWTRRQAEYERRDLVIMLDRSASMNARDIEPSRFARATHEIRSLVRQKPEDIDRIALVGFADAAVVLSYLTEDVNSLLFYLDWIDTDPTPLFGTNIGAALTSAIDVARKDDRPTKKLFLLVSDGEDFGAELRGALAAARTAGYAVNCIGVGSERSVPIPVRGIEGPAGRAGNETLLHDDTGQPVTTRFEEGTLRHIAAATGGQYVRSVSGDELRRAIATLAGGERRFVGWRTSTERRDLYPALLAIAAGAGVALWMLL
jgi:Ca-activated chloride channel family protein